MLLFFVGLFILIFGYFTYGRFIENIFMPTNDETPAKRLNDGVDFLVLPHWKNMLIQLLNIAGIGPVIGLILGIKFGPWVFIILPIGNILGGAVHDYCSGMMSIRHNGANLPKLIQLFLGKKVNITFFLTAVLLLVVAVFVNIPAQLLISPSLLNAPDAFIWAVLLIFAYYMMATLFPVDKIIGQFYPVFGGTLIIATIALFFSLFATVIKDPTLLTPAANFPWEQKSIIPFLFVTIACGIISGFHATQSPIVARTMSHERQGRQVFYGMMVTEGLIGMIWGAAGMIIYNLFPETHSLAGPKVLGKIADYFLGSFFGRVSVIGVIILAITSGDTALRSLRLSIAEYLNIPQQKFSSRFLICVPIFVVVVLLLIWSNKDAASFNLLWNYFAWANQVLAAITLLAASVALYLIKPRYIFVALLPGCFMTFIVCAYILICPFPAIKGLPYHLALITSTIFTLLLAFAIWKHSKTVSLEITQNKSVDLH